MPRLFALFVAGSLAFSASASGASRVGYLEIEGALPDRPDEMDQWCGQGDSDTLPGLVDEIMAASDPADPVDGLVLRVSGLAAPTTAIEELGAAMSAAREAGVRVHVFADSYGTGELLLASFADEAIAQRGGGMWASGMIIEEMFLADTLAMAGVDAEFIQIGDYKGASETLGNSGPSDAWDQNISALLDGLWAATIERIAEGRGMDVRQAERSLGACFLTDAETGVEEGMIDVAIDRLALQNHLESVYGEDFRWDARLRPGGRRGGPPDLAQMGMFEAFNQMMQLLSGTATYAPERDSIAVLHIAGTIVEGESVGGGLLGGASVGSATVRKALLEIEENPLIKGLVVRVDSPGGSAVASEIMWRGVRRVVDSGKPVWVSVGPMAASGGYYVAVAGERIFVNPSSIVGSIGVVGGKIDLSGLYNKLDMNVVQRTRGPNAAFMGTVGGFGDTERAFVRRRMEETYDQFVARVEAGREGIDIARTAEGRLFDGARAVEMRLADEVGTLDDAVTRLASRLDLADGGYDVVDYPAPRSFEEILEEAFGAGLRAGGAGVIAGPIREVLGERAWSSLASTLQGLLLVRDEPVLLVSPRALVIR